MLIYFNILWELDMELQLCVSSLICYGSMVQGLGLGFFSSFVCEVLLQYEECVQRFVISCGH